MRHAILDALLLRSGEAAEQQLSIGTDHPIPLPPHRTTGKRLAGRLQRLRLRQARIELAIELNKEG